jgi:hypothetical protein
MSASPLVYQVLTDVLPEQIVVKDGEPPVPVISTTFATFDRLLSHLHEEELRWLLIDEAGQAVPQAAAGAMMAPSPVTRFARPPTVDGCEPERRPPPPFDAANGLSTYDGTAVQGQMRCSLTNCPRRSSSAFASSAVRESRSALVPT